MYKSLIKNIAEEKANQIEAERKANANQKRMEKAKYNTSDLFVGFLSMIITTKYHGKVYLKQLTDSKPHIFRHTALDTFQDIETEKFYPLIADGKVPKECEYCVTEASLESFESACIQVLEIKGIESNTKLTKQQLRAILDEQNKLDEYRY